jgi:hypothetical protein
MRRRSSQARAQAAASEAVIPRMITAGPTVTDGRPYAKPNTLKPTTFNSRLPSP